MNPGNKLDGSPADGLPGAARPGHCETCAHWRSEGWAYEDITRDRDADLEPTGPEYAKRCHSPKLLFYERPAPDGACVVDGSQYRASLLTGPKFGCTNYEPEPQATPPERSNG